MTNEVDLASIKPVDCDVDTHFTLRNVFVVRTAVPLRFTVPSVPYLTSVFIRVPVAVINQLTVMFRLPSNGEEWVQLRPGRAQ